MAITIPHDLAEETPEAKARWFQSLSLSERMDLLCLFTDLVLENNPLIAERKDAKPIAGPAPVIAKARSQIHRDRLNRRRFATAIIKLHSLIYRGVLFIPHLSSVV